MVHSYSERLCNNVNIMAQQHVHLRMIKNMDYNTLNSYDYCAEISFKAFSNYLLTQELDFHYAKYKLLLRDHNHWP